MPNRSDTHRSTQNLKEAAENQLKSNQEHTKSQTRSKSAYTNKGAIKDMQTDGQIHMI